jgi:hypothetical protein
VRLRDATAMWQQGPSSAFDGVDIEELRTRLRKMSDNQLIEFGRAARFMCSLEASFGKPPRAVFVDQLNAAREEWRRRKTQARGC